MRACVDSCGNAGRWEEALQLINKLEALALDGGGVPMSTTLYNFAIDTVSAFCFRWCNEERLTNMLADERPTPTGAPEVHFRRKARATTSAYRVNGKRQLDIISARVNYRLAKYISLSIGKVPIVP